MESFRSFRQTFPAAARRRSASALSRRRICWSVHTKGIIGPRSTPSDEYVPEMEGLVLKRVQSNDLGRFDRRRPIEEQQRDFGGSLRKEREVDAVGVRRRPERVGRTGFEREGLRLWHRAC